MKWNHVLAVLGLALGITGLALAIANVDATPTIEPPAALREAMAASAASAAAEPAPVVSTPDSGVADQLPPERLAAVLADGPAKVRFAAEAPVEPAVAAEISRAMVRAWDNMWHRKLQLEKRGSAPDTNSCAVDFCLAIWPDLARMMAAGDVQQSISKRSPSDRAQPGSVSFGFDDKLSVFVKSENWVLTLKFSEKDNTSPELFARIVAANRAVRDEYQRSLKETAKENPK